MTPLASEERRGEMPDQESMFRAIRAVVLNDYERDLKRRSAERERHQVAAGRIQAEVQALLERSNLDVAGADALIEDEREEMEKYVEQARSQLAALAPHRAERLHGEAERALGLIQAGWSQAFLLGVDVVGEASESHDGEVGNPATWLYDANKQWKGKISMTGEVGTCDVHVPYHPATAIFYFAWPPTFTGPCTVGVFLGYYGSKTLYAFPVPFQFCASAHAYGKGRLEVYQQVGYSKSYKWLALDEAILLDQTITSGVVTGRVDDFRWLTADVTLASTGQMYLAISATFDVAVGGPLAYAELNFQDGSNYVLPPIVAIKSKTP